MATLGVVSGLSLFGLLLLGMAFSMTSFLNATRRPDLVVDRIKRPR